MDTDKKFKERLLEEFDIPQMAIKDCAHIELSGNREASIEGCRGIVEYSDDKIVLNLGGVCVRFCGDGQQIRSFDGENVTISGYFCSIEFC